MPKSSLLIINKSFPPDQSSSGRLAFDLAHYMAAKGWRVSVLCEGQGATQNSATNITVIPVKKSTKNNIFSDLVLKFRFIQASFKMKHHQYIVTMTDPLDLILLKRFFVRKKIQKHIHWVEDLYPEIIEALENKNLQKEKTKMLKALKSTDKIVVTGRDVANKIRQKNILTNKISYIPNWTILHGSHLQDFGHQESQALQSLDHLKKDDSQKFRIIYAGNLQKEHPIGIMIKAAEILRDHEEIEFLFIGDQHAHSRLSKERDKRELSNMRFIPFQPPGHFQRILETGDVHLVSLRPQVTGLTVPCKFYASLAVGRPCIFIGSSDSEIGQVIKEFKNGDIVDDMSPETLAKTILKYREDGNVWFSAQEGALKASETFYPDNSLQQWAKLLEAL
ncbi:MAG: glycosyltransferase family 4 protein [Pseudomonadota bacterium]